jgi:hypothetical protein
MYINLKIKAEKVNYMLHINDEKYKNKENNSEKKNTNNKAICTKFIKITNETRSTQCARWDSKFLEIWDDNGYSKEYQSEYDKQGYRCQC